MFVCLFGCPAFFSATALAFGILLAFAHISAPIECGMKWFILIRQIDENSVFYYIMEFTLILTQCFT